MKKFLAFALPLILWSCTIIMPPGPGTSPTPEPSVSLQPSSSPSPQASPSPSVSPSPVPSPSPSPSPSASPLAVVATRNVKEGPNWAFDQTLWSARNETPYFLLKASVTECEPIVLTGLPADITSKFHQVQYYTTTKASTKGTRVGKWADPLIPTASICPGDIIWVDLKVAKTAAPAAYDILYNGAKIVTLNVIARTQPDKPVMPLYMEMGGFVAMQAQGYDKNSQVSIEAPVHAAYIKACREDLVEPYKQTIVGVVADINQWSDVGGSFKQLALDGAIAPPCLLAPTGTYGGGGLYPATLLSTVQSLMASGAVPADSWGYIRDEDAATYDSAIIPIFQQVKTAVPTLRRMMTENRASLDAYVTDPVFDFESWSVTPVAGRSQNRSNFWLYGACQSQGTCSNGFQGTPTGSPMMLIDSPGAHQRAFPLVGKVAGARAMLYYNTTESLITAWNTDGQYKFGGHGEGTMFYPTKGNAAPVQSVRMKLVRQGMQDASYIDWAGLAAVTIKSKLAVLPMTATEQDLEEMHNTLAQASNGLMQRAKVYVGLSQ